MKFFQHKLLTILLAAMALTIVSCNKDDDDEPSTPVCTLKTAFIFDSGTTPEDTATYVYSGTNIVRVNYASGEYYTLEYNSNNKVTKKSYFDPAYGTTAYEYHTITYNADGTISKMEYFTEDGSGGFFNYGRALFTYTAGKISNVKVDYNFTGTWVTYEDLNYVFTGNNITAINGTYYYGSTPETVNYTFTYDSKANYFRKQNANYLFIDPFFAYFDPTMMIFSESANNLTGGDLDGAFSVNTLTGSNDNVTELQFDGETAVKYNYECK